MKKLILLFFAMIAFNVNCVDMSPMRSRTPTGGLARSVSLERERDVSSIRSRTPPLEHAAYIPQHYDHTEEFHNESVLCFKLRRWVFQPISVVLQVTAGGFFVGGQCCIDKYPETAKILNGVGLGVSVASFVINTLLLKIDNKLEEMDNYILQRREEQRRETQIYPAIIQR